MKERTLQSLDTRHKALLRLRQALDEPQDNALLLDAAIQRFEFSIELCWKSLAKFLYEYEAIEITLPIKAFKAAYKAGWLDDEDFWIEMWKNRNITSHTYKEDLAKKIFSHLEDYHTAMSNLETTLRNQIKEYQQ